MEQRIEGTEDKLVVEIKKLIVESDKRISENKELIERIKKRNHELGIHLEGCKRR